MAELVERKVSGVFFGYKDEDGRRRTAWRGDTVQLTEKEAARGDSLGAFAGQKTVHADPVEGYDNSPRKGGINTTIGRPLADGEMPLVPSEMTNEQIDALSGKELDDACETAGVDITAGGSLADGSLSADEKRQALKDAA